MTAGILVAFLAFLSIAKPQRTHFKYIGAFLGCSLATEVVVAVVVDVFDENANLLYSIYSIFVCPLILLFYKQEVKWPVFQTAATALIWLLIAFGFINLFFIQGETALNSHMKVVNSVTVILLVLVHFYFLLKEHSGAMITQSVAFWVSTSLLVYFAGAFISYLAVDYIINTIKDENYETMILTWTVHNCVGIVSYLLMCWAFILARRNSSF